MEQQAQQSHADHLNDEWNSRMGIYTNLTLDEFDNTIYTRYNGDMATKKTLTMEERFLLSKVKELCWGYSTNPRGLGTWVASKKKLDYTDHNGCCFYSNEDEYADSGRNYQQWLQYRKDNKIRTFL